jgi:4-amino-4-deoxy-L-arabinose transferase-like glycosyltransferase
VNNDALLIPMAALAITLAASADPRRSRVSLLVVLGAVLGVGLLAKPQMVFVGICVGLLLLARVAAEPGRARATARLAFVAAGTALTFGWWAAYAMTRFGSPFGAMAFQQVGSGSGSLRRYLATSVTWDRTYTLWVRRYWASFGWLDTDFRSRLPYVALLLLVVLAAAGVLRNLLWHGEPDRARLAALAGFVLLNFAFLYAVEAAHVRQFRSQMLQGRYLLTSLLPIGALLLLGWRAFVPERARAWVDVAAVIGSGLLNAAALLLLLRRYYGIEFG